MVLVEALFLGGDCSTSRPKHNPPGKVQWVDTSKDKTTKASAGVGTVQRSVETIVGQARCGETWMRRNDYNDSQQQQSNDHVQSATPELEPRAHEKNCVWQVKDARSVVCC